MITKCSECRGPRRDPEQEHPGVCVCGGYLTDREINICVPVLRRYDLLRDMVRSCMASNVQPDNYYIIDNGKNGYKLLQALGDLDLSVKVHTPAEPLGVAASWNWFIRHVPEERVIVNDDITFAPDSIEKIVALPHDLVWASGFSCFLLRDACVQKIGLFDETISPGYGYYEDEDYLQRLDGRGSRPPSAKALNVEAGVQHLRSQTLAVATPAEAQEHHRKFKIAQQNYARKWHLEAAFGLPVPKVEVGA